MLIVVLLALSSLPLSKGALDVLAPDVRYAGKSLEGLISSVNVRCVGIACLDGVLLAAVKSKEGPSEAEGLESRSVLEQTRRIDYESSLAYGRCIFELDRGVHVAVSGWQADMAYFIRYLREVCARHRSQFGTSMDAEEVAEESSRFLYALSTEDGTVRPLVVSILVGGTLSAQSIPRRAMEMDSECTVKPASRFTNACLFKVDTTGVLQEISAGITGPFVAEDLVHLRGMDETDATPEGTDGEGDSGQKAKNERMEEKDSKNDIISTESMLRYLRKSMWHKLSVKEALEVIKREGYLVIESNYI